jgi:hypothetical protein
MRKHIKNEYSGLVLAPLNKKIQLYDFAMRQKRRHNPILIIKVPSETEALQI